MHITISTVSCVSISLYVSEMLKARQKPLSSFYTHHDVLLSFNALLRVTHLTGLKLSVAGAKTLPDHPISYCRSSGI